MRLGLNVQYWGSAARDDTDLVREAERLGYHSVWAAEAYGSDCVTVLSWLAARTESIMVGSAIMQMPARTPAMTAMTAATLDGLSGGRFLCGLGVSGPQVVEGWHGVPYGRPLRRTREYVEILRSVWRRDTVVHDGAEYQIPWQGEGATGMGKPLKLITHPKNPDIPIYLAAIGTANTRLAAEIADGWLPTFYSPAKADSVWGAALDDGFAASGDPTKRDRFDIAPGCAAVVTDDLDAARDRIRPHVALYVGGMGAKGRNFYNELAARYGYEAEAAKIQDLYLAGHVSDAVAAVPDGLIDETNLVGNRAQITDRLAVWKDAGVSTLVVSTSDLATLRLLPELAN